MAARTSSCALIALWLAVVFLSVCLLVNLIPQSCFLRHHPTKYQPVANGTTNLQLHQNVEAPAKVLDNWTNYNPSLIGSTLWDVTFNETSFAAQKNAHTQATRETLKTVVQAGDVDALQSAIDEGHGEGGGADAETVTSEDEKVATEDDSEKKAEVDAAGDAGTDTKANATADGEGDTKANATADGEGDTKTSTNQQTDEGHAEDSAATEATAAATQKLRDEKTKAAEDAGGKEKKQEQPAEKQKNPQARKPGVFAGIKRSPSEKNHYSNATAKVDSNSGAVKPRQSKSGVPDHRPPFVASTNLHSKRQPVHK